MKKATIFNSKCNTCVLTDSDGPDVGSIYNTEILSEVEIFIIGDFLENIDVDFKNILNNINFKDIKYYVTSLSWCRKNNIKSEMDNIKSFDNCRPNWSNILKKCKPRVIVALGQNVLNEFIKNQDIDSCVGRVLKKNNQSIYISECPRKNPERVRSDLEYIKNTIQQSAFDKNNIMHSFNLPDWCYDKNHILIDIQANKNKKELIFIFRDSDGKKIYHRESSKNNYFYTMDVPPEEAPIVTSAKSVKLRKDKLIGSNNTIVSKFNEDVPIELKHSIDYSYIRNIKKVPETNYKLKCLFWDIEVYNENQQSFPTPRKAERKINSISFKLDNGPVFVYLLNINNILNENIIDISNELDFKLEYKTFNNEETLIREFCKKVVELDPDVLSGWNTDSFDIPYLFNRMNKLGIDPDIISPLNETYIDIENNKYTIFGLYSLDQMFLYMSSVQNKEASYKLSYIATKNLGKDKVAYEGTLDTIYESDINKFIEYSAVDTNLLYELEDNLNHIGLRFELIKICSSTWEKAETTSGRADPLSLKYAKENHSVCRNRLKNEMRTFPGAYVVDPNPGIHKWVVDFDFKSLYPSIICTFNIGSNTFVAKINELDAKDFLYDRSNMKDEIDIKYDPIKGSSKTVKIKSKDFINYIIENNYIVSLSGSIFKSHDEELSFLNKILSYLMDSRDIYKSKAKNILGTLNSPNTLSEKDKSNLEIEMKKYETMQIAYKILANSLYGVLGNPYFRFYNIDLAEAITVTGKEILQYSITHLSSYMKNKTLDINMNFLNEFNENRHAYNVYGDSVGFDSKIETIDHGCIGIEDLWNILEEDPINIDGKERKNINIKVLSCDDNKNNIYLECVQIIRHKVNKKVYRIFLDSYNYKHVDVTEDHSLITYDNNFNFIETKPLDSKYAIMTIDSKLEIVDIYGIKELEYDNYVYDLCVPSTQRFYANDILVHNTDSIFVALGDYLIDNNKF